MGVFFLPTVFLRSPTSPSRARKQRPRAAKWEAGRRLQIHWHRRRYVGIVADGMFEYLSPPRLLTPRDLLDVPTFSNPLPSWLHLVSYPERAEQSLSEISSMSAELGTGRSWTPGILWEPEPVGPRLAC